MLKFHGLKGGVKLPQNDIWTVLCLPQLFAHDYPYRTVEDGSVQLG